MKSKVTEEAREVNGDDDKKGNPKRGINTEKRSTLREETAKEKEEYTE